jgi:hypothetical protein
MSTHAKDPEKDIVPATTTVVVESPDLNLYEHEEKHRVKASELDDAAEFIAGFGREVTEEEAARVRRKIDLHMLPLMCVVLLRGCASGC